MENCTSVAVHVETDGEIHLTEYENKGRTAVCIKLCGYNFGVFMTEAAAAQQIADLFTEAAGILRKAEANHD